MPKPNLFAAALAASLLSILVAPSAHAAVPAHIPVEGFLRTPGGGPVADGKYVLTISLYGAVDAVDPLWFEVHPIVEVGTGFFHLVLGTSKAGGQALPVGLFASEAELWVGVQVSDDPELARQRLYAVPYALRAASAVTADTAEALTGVLDGKQVAPGSLSDSALGFTFAGSKQKHGAADMALDLQCTGCVSVSEIAFDDDIDLGGGALKATKVVATSVVADSVIAGEVSAQGFVGNGAGLTDLPFPASACVDQGFVRGIEADGSIVCADVITPAGACEAPNHVVVGIHPDGTLKCVEVAPPISGDLTVPGDLGVGSLDPGWRLNVDGWVRADGLKLNGTAVAQKCDADHRGVLWFFAGGDGVADKLSVCRKKKDGTYGWVAVVDTVYLPVKTGNCTSHSNFCGGPNNTCSLKLDCASGALTGTNLVTCSGNGCSPSSKAAQPDCDGKASCTITFKHTSGCCCDSDDYRTGFAEAICQ